MERRTAFVTGATGLLGNNLVRGLLDAGWQVKALARNQDKAQRQFRDLTGVEVVPGDLAKVGGFAAALAGSDVLFHAAAHFRDAYKGGNHWAELKRINVDGTTALLEAAYRAGVRKMVYTSSIAVLNGMPGQLISEANDRDEKDADDYYRSKIYAERAVSAFLQTHPDFDACFVLPGWMWGPGDIGPTSAGQVALDVVKGALPGLVPGSFSVVDARDVATAQIAAVTKGRRGERYLAAGRHMTMHELIPLIGRVAGVKTPTRTIPLPLLYALATVQELYGRVTGRPILIGLAAVKSMAKEADRTRFDPSKSQRELGLEFRPVETTIHETLGWYRENGWLDVKAAKAGSASLKTVSPVRPTKRAY